MLVNVHGSVDTEVETFVSGMFYDTFLVQVSGRGIDRIFVAFAGNRYLVTVGESGLENGVNPICLRKVGTQCPVGCVGIRVQQPVRVYAVTARTVFIGGIQCIVAVFLQPHRIFQIQVVCHPFFRRHHFGQAHGVLET